MKLRSMGHISAPGILCLTLILIGCPPNLFADSPGDTTSYILTLDVYTGNIDTILVANTRFEAPNWHRDNYLIVNSRGRIHKLDLETKKLTRINTGFAVACNNDHGISPDQEWLAISHNTRDDHSSQGRKSVIYIVPIGGGEPRRVTSEGRSYWHGWSPDGQRLVYCGERNGNYDVYSISVDGGPETRLTTAEGLDDGPEYSPDGKYIYFNSYRMGRMQIWRMQPDGKMPEQLTFDDLSNWFPHPSPDNKSVAYIAYTSDEGQRHPFGKSVKLRLLDLETRVIRDLTPVFLGGQGTINVPSWNAESTRIAFVSYSIR